MQRYILDGDRVVAVDIEILFEDAVDPVGLLDDGARGG
jgi:hypothetical protein